MLELWGEDRHEQIRLFGEQVLPHVRRDRDGCSPTARARIARYTPDGSDGGDVLLVDLRSNDERARDGIIPGSVHVPRSVLEWRCDQELGLREPAARRTDGSCSSARTASRRVSLRRRSSSSASTTPAISTEASRRGATAGLPGRGARPSREGVAGDGRAAVKVDRDRLVETASALIDVHSFTGDEQAMAELMVALYEELGLQVQWQQVEDGRANALGTWAGTGGGKSLMFNGHMDTSYSGREPWLRDVPGFQPQAFEQDGRLYGLGISNMKGALACYVEAVRALQDAGVRLRGDVLIAAVCGEIEKTQYGDAQGAQYRGYAAGSRYLVSHGGVADMCLLGEPTEGKVVLGHFGALWLRIRVHGNFIHTAFSEGKRDQNAILRMHEVTGAVLEWIPTWEDDESNALPRREGDRQRRRRRGRLRLARLADAAPRRSVPRHPRAADEADGASRGARCSSSCARSPSASPTTASRARST